MSRSISISVPYNYLAISSAAKMLTNVAEELKNEDAVETAPDRNDNEVDPTPVVEEPEAKQVFAPVTDVPVPPVADVPAPPAPPVETEDPTGPEDSLDANGLPWDARIHAATKTKDKAGNWKYLRGVDRDVLVPEVEAELKAMVGEPVVDDIPTPPAPPAPAVETPVTDVTPSTSVTTFAQLVTGITTNQIPEDKVSAAIAAVGLQNFALLGARADLIPTVAGHLGL